MSSHRFPEMHYITEPERAQLYPAIVRVSSIPSIPSTFPFKVPVSPPTARGPRYTIGWMEFQSAEQPDPDVARPGDVWIQLPLGHRKARVYACYARDGKDWSPWVGNAASMGDRTVVRTHPFLDSDHAQRRFFLVFNGHDFTWANIKAISNIQHHHLHVARMGPADAVARWLDESGKKGSGSRRAAKEELPDEDDVHTVSAPPPTRKHPRSEPNGAVAESASAPPNKKPKHTLRDQVPSPSERSPLVRSGPYAKAGATQAGWLMYVNGVQLKMPTPCTNCFRDKTPCSGLPGQRCGRCRFKRRWCSHSSASSSPQVPTGKKVSAEDESVGDNRSSPAVTRGKTSRSAARKSRTPTKPKAATKNPRTEPVSRPRYNLVAPDRSSSSPLSSVGSLGESDSESSDEENGELDAPDDRDDAAVENMLNNAVAASMSGPADDGEPSSSVTAADGADRALPRDMADEDEEEEELARFVQMTLDGMARVQEGLRGVFTLQRRKSGVARRGSLTKQVASA